VEKLLDFCYTEEYTDSSAKSKHFLVHAQMYTLSDKYGITRLRSRAKSKLCGWEGVNTLASMSSTSVADLNDMLAAISHVYQNTQENDALRIAMVRCPWDRTLLQEHRGEWMSFLSLNPEYACDMTLYCSEKIAKFEEFTETMTEFVCPKCEQECIMNAWRQEDRVFTCAACSQTYDWLTGGGNVPEEQPTSRSEDWETTLS